MVIGAYWWFLRLLTNNRQFAPFSRFPVILISIGMWGHVVVSGGHVVVSGGVIWGSFEGHLGVIWGSFGVKRGSFGGHLGVSEVICDHLGVKKGSRTGHLGVSGGWVELMLGGSLWGQWGGQEGVICHLWVSVVRLGHVGSRRDQ